jgi:YD repeat-containing protein
VYDSLGRMEAAIDPTAATNGLARYAYDAVGNLVSVTRSSTSAVTIVDFHPAHAAVGASLTIYGAGFDATTSNDVVKFTKTDGSLGSQSRYWRHTGCGRRRCL